MKIYCATTTIIWGKGWDQYDPWMVWLNRPAATRRFPMMLFTTRRRIAERHIQFAILRQFRRLLSLTFLGRLLVDLYNRRGRAPTFALMFAYKFLKNSGNDDIRQVANKIPTIIRIVRTVVGSPPDVTILPSTANPNKIRQQYLPHVLFLLVVPSNPSLNLNSTYYYHFLPSLYLNALAYTDTFFDSGAISG